MIFIKLINRFSLNIVAIKANDIPISQGFDTIVLSRDFITGLLLGTTFVFILIGLSKKSES